MSTGAVNGIDTKKIKAQFDKKRTHFVRQSKIQ